MTAKARQFTVLIDDSGLLFKYQCGKSVLVKQFLCHILDLLDGNFVNMVIKVVHVLLPTIMKETFAEVKGEVLSIVTRHTYLTLYLFLCRTELRIRKGLFHKLIQFFTNQTKASLYVMLVTPEIDAPYTSVAVCNHRALYGID